MANFDAYQMVTDRIISLLESGIIPWARPWSNVKSCAWSRSTGNPYSFINQMLLADPDKKYPSLEAMLADVAGEYVTFKQAQELGGHVRKGEKGRRIVFYKMLDVPDGTQDEDGNPGNKRIPFLKSYTVFRIDQCEGIQQKHHISGDQQTDFTANTDADQLAADYITREGITLNHYGNQAYYAPALDLVVLPDRKQFNSPEAYYSTLFHELTHSTGHESRLNRLTKNAAFGDDSYSTEELVAEIGSASILATLGMGTDGTLRNSAAYVQNWLKALKADKKMVVFAAARAEKAMRRIFNLTTEQPET